MPDTPSSRQVRIATWQAKGLAQLFGVDHAYAQDILAQAVYDCDHWHDLQDRIETNRLQPTGRTLLRVAEDRQVRHDFEQMLDGLVERLARAVSTDHLGPIQLRAGVYEAFTANEKTFPFPELFPTIAMPAWRNANIGPQPNAVLTADVDIEGQAFRLFAFRTCLEPFTSDKTDFGGCLNDIPVSGHIVWAKRKQWEKVRRQHEARANLPSKAIHPRQTLNGVMSQIEAWFEELRNHVSDVLLGTGEKRLVMPLIFKGAPYVVVGLPISLGGDSGLGQLSLQYPRIVYLNGFPLVIDKALAPSKQNSPKHSLFDKLALREDEGALVYARSASLADIEFVLDLRYRPQSLHQHEGVYEWSHGQASPQRAMDIIEKVARHGVVQRQGPDEVEVAFEEPIVEVGQGSRFCVFVAGSGDSRKQTTLWIRAVHEDETDDVHRAKTFVVDPGLWEAMRLSWGNIDERRKQWLDWSRRVRS